MTKERLIEAGYETKNNLDFFNGDITVSFFKNVIQVWSISQQKILEEHEIING